MDNNVCVDRVLPGDLRDLRQHRPGRQEAAFEIGKTWPQQSTMRIAFAGGTSAQRDQVQQVASQWNAYHGLKLEWITRASQAMILIGFREGEGSWSYIGTDAQKVSGPTMNFGWLDEGTILHEFGHALGMVHEHQNPVGNPIQWDEAAVIRDLSGPPNYWDEATIRHNVIERYSANQVNASEFDPRSIMLYSFPRSWTKNGWSAGRNSTLSEGDKAHTARVYGQATEPPAPLIALEPVEPPGVILHPGREVQFVLRVHTDGMYRIETLGDLDVIARLYRQQPLLLLAEDDDSGQQRNALLRRFLERGTYLVQVRAYHASEGGPFQVFAVKEG